jgi:hypothetical protein
MGGGWLCGWRRRGFGVCYGPTHMNSHTHHTPTPWPNSTHAGVVLSSALSRGRANGRTGAKVFKAGGLRLLIDVSGVASGEPRPFTFRQHGEEVFFSNAPEVLMDGVAAGSRRVGNAERGRFGAGLTISLDIALGPQGPGLKGSAAYNMLHQELGFQRNSVTRMGRRTALSQLPLSPPPTLSHSNHAPVAAQLVYSVSQCNGVRLGWQGPARAPGAQRRAGDVPDSCKGPMGDGPRLRVCRSLTAPRIAPPRESPRLPQAEQRAQTAESQSQALLLANRGLVAKVGPPCVPGRSRKAAALPQSLSGRPSSALRSSATGSPPGTAARAAPLREGARREGEPGPACRQPEARGRGEGVERRTGRRMAGEGALALPLDTLVQRCSPGDSDVCRGLPTTVTRAPTPCTGHKAPLRAAQAEAAAQIGAGEREAQDKGVPDASAAQQPRILAPWQRGRLGPTGWGQLHTSQSTHARQRCTGACNTQPCGLGRGAYSHAYLCELLRHAVLLSVPAGDASEEAEGLRSGLLSPSSDAHTGAAGRPPGCAHAPGSLAHEQPAPHLHTCACGTGSGWGLCSLQASCRASGTRR